MANNDYALSDCLNWDFNYEGDCGGPVEERTSRSGATTSVKCENCYNALQERLDEIESRYPDSPFAPSWFDPTYAGETWDCDY